VPVAAPEAERTITVREAARYLGKSRATIARWADEDGWLQCGIDARGRRWFLLSQVLDTYKRKVDARSAP
jgi:hypothetical protein